MTCKECAYKEDCCFYRKEEEDWTCVYETFKHNRDTEDNAKKRGKIKNDDRRNQKKNCGVEKVFRR